VASETTGLLFGVIGSPIGHSMSPALHRAAYAALDFPAEYDSTEVGAGGLAEFLRSSPASRRGVSVTMPLKREAWLAASTRDHAAELTGAVNTLVRADGGERLSGSNTDVAGIVGAVQGAGRREVGHVLIIGAGATAASAVVAAADLGARSLTLAVRSPERAEGAVGLGRSLGLATTVRRLAEVAEVRADVVVSTIPGGQELAVLPRASLVPGSLLLDVAYSPWPSALVTCGVAGGATVVHGLSMLVHQAAQQVRLFADLRGSAWSEVADRVTNAMFEVVGLPATGVVRALP
jgi:shikimate dehydrogenase